MALVNDIYEKRKLKYGKLHEKQARYANIISNTRLAVFIAGVVALILLYRTNKNFYLLVLAFLLWFIPFIYLVYKHEQLKKRMKYTAILVEINDKSVKRLQGGWKSFSDAGEDFVDHNHNYSYDLDIFGQGSLFQWVNTANTFTGRQKLRQALVDGFDCAQVIDDRQAAIQELAMKLGWRQKFMAEGLLVKGSMNEPDQLLKWVQDRNDLILKPAVVWSVRVLPAITITTLLLANLKLVPNIIPILLIAIQVILLRIDNKKRSSMFDTAEKYKADVKIYEKMLKHLEKPRFTASYLANLKKKLYDRDGVSASRQIDRLSRIVDSISNRYNIFYFVIDALLLLQYQSAIALEAWKLKSGRQIKGWLDAVAEMESLASLAVIPHDHPDWAKPVFENGLPRLVASKMGHPLLEQPVCNDFKIAGPGTVLLITGSNMSGKSTLLRTVGINLVLAYAGAPVCADTFLCPIMDLYTCMRVNDNLEQRISSFYAELLRIKQIVSAVAEGKRVFFLLDEIFKGTNSWDRHTGAMVLVRQLSKAGCLGLISTHDLELGALEQEHGIIVKNCHFDEHYQNNEICFDYQLKPGVSTTRNAKYLMKLAGIDIDDGRISEP